MITTIMKKILLLTLVLLCAQHMYCQSDTTKTDYLKNYFGYSLVIDMNHLQHNDKYNYKYLINKSYDVNSHDSTIFLEDNSLYYVRYDYVAIDDGYKYDRVSLDTVMVRLTNEQLKSIFRLAIKLYEIDPASSLNYQPNYSTYDGNYVQVKLTLQNYSTNHHVGLAFDFEGLFQKRFLELEAYIEKIKNQQ